MNNPADGLEEKKMHKWKGCTMQRADTQSKILPQ